MVSPQPMPTSVASAEPLSIHGSRLKAFGYRSANQGVKTIALTGDTIVHLGVASAAARHGEPFDFAPLFTEVSHLLSGADLAICHLEVPLSADGEDISSYPLFNSPPELADGLAAVGYDGCSTASNHSYDAGVHGVQATLRALSAAGLVQSGMAAEPGQGWEAALYELGELTIGHVAGTYWLNGLRMPSDKPWLVQLLDPAEMIHAAARAKGEGADLVVASMHCCTEYRVFPTSTQLEIAHTLIESPYIDLVVTHHSHVIGPVEVVGGEFIFHGLGNFLSGQTHKEATRDGVIAMVNAVRRGGSWRFETAEVVPTQVVAGTYRVVPVDRESTSFARTMEAINSMGAGIGVYMTTGLTTLQLALIE